MAISDNETIAQSYKDHKLFQKLSPAQILVLGFAAVILTGALLLTLPIASASGNSTSFIDALFTSTSAVCVTGLVVVDTGTHYSVFGQVVIMLLIQIGGLGFMTMATLFAFIIGKKIRLRERLIMQEALNQVTIEGVVRLARSVLLITAIIEGAAAVILAMRWIPEFGLTKGLYFGLFHAVSAFNNAGFDLFGHFRSLTPYVSDFTVNIVISSLIILGGIGFTVIAEVISKKNWRKFSLHTKSVLTITAILLVGGMISIFLLEYSNPKTLGTLGIGSRILASWFQSVTPRTAGFNSLDIASLRSATQFLIIILMFIGASPNSTGGGIKTSTVGVLFSTVWSNIRGNQDVELFERRLPKDVIFRSLTISLASLALVGFVTMLLSITEKADFLTILFETTSAFGTVGLTMGLTTKLSLIGKLAITLTMYAGRVGPVTIAFAMAQKQHKPIFHYAEEKIIVG